MEEISVALPAALKDGREGRADMVPWMERILHILLAQKKEGAAYLGTKACRKPKIVLLGCERLLMNEVPL